jgi:voltage-gated potassium channel
MSTLGFGDITFESDLGRIFSVVVLLSGSLFILVLLPFTFIQFVFVPWMESTASGPGPPGAARRRARPRVLTGTGAIEDALIPGSTGPGSLRVARRRPRRGAAAPRRGLPGDGRRPSTTPTPTGPPASTGRAGGHHPGRHHQHQRRVHRAGDLRVDVPVVATANSAASVDILQLAGCDEVLQLGEMLGRRWPGGCSAPTAAAR